MYDLKGTGVCLRIVFELLSVLAIEFNLWCFDKGEYADFISLVIDL